MEGEPEMAKRRKFTAAFKARVAQEALRGDRTVKQIAARHDLHPNQVSQWKKKAGEGLVDLFCSPGATGGTRASWRRSCASCTRRSGSWRSSAIS